MRLANISGDGSRNEGSGVVGLEVEHVGENWDFQTEKGVSPLDTLSHATGLFERGLFANATEIIGHYLRPRTCVTARFWRATALGSRSLEVTSLTPPMITPCDLSVDRLWNSVAAPLDLCLRVELILPVCKKLAALV